MTPRAWTILVPLPTWTVNQSRSNHHFTEARLVRDYRAAACLLARQARIPQLDRIAVEATPFGPKIRQDVGACYPAVKAAIDGLIDACCIPNDTPEHVCRITMHQPRRGEHGLHLLVLDLADLAPDHGCYQASLALDAT